MVFPQSHPVDELYRVFGPIVEEETFVKHRNYGFVKFRHREDAERAKREMDGKFLGRGGLLVFVHSAVLFHSCVFFFFFFFWKKANF
jgi:hypothetical protein